MEDSPLDDLVVEESRPSKSAIQAVIYGYFTVDEQGCGTDVEQTEDFTTLTQKEQVIAATFLGELLSSEPGACGKSATDIGYYVGAMSSSNITGDSLEWNYYAVLRSLEKDGIIVRENGGYYISPEHSESVLSSLE